MALGAPSFKSATCIGSRRSAAIPTFSRVKADVAVCQRVDQFLIHAVCCAQMKFALLSSKT